VAEKEQNLANHARIDPMFHGFLFFVGLLLLGLTIWQAVTVRTWTNHILILMVIWGLVLMFKTRLYALKVQDRVIRLEERLRLAQLLPENLRVRIGELSESQLVGLRFASDTEVAGLVEKTLGQGLTNKQIKEQVKNWRADHWRV
jgi:Family of unknown function (DUF6526)